MVTPGFPPAGMCTLGCFSFHLDKGSHPHLGMWIRAQSVLLITVGTNAPFPAR